MTRARNRPSTRALATAGSLDEFLRTVPPLASVARYQLLQQARLLLEGLYVHLELKRAMYATDPVQRLRLLERRLDTEHAAGPGGATSTVSDLQFHAELAAIFRGLRDLHTVYQLPDPYRGNVATLGFLVESYTDARGRRRYVASKIDPTVADRVFKPGVELLAWNGIPVDRAVELNADRQAGSNVEARLARGLEALTLRPLRSSPPPDERWVTIEFCTPAGDEYEKRLDWLVLPAAAGPKGRPHDPVATGAALLGIDAGNEAGRQIKRALFASTERVRTADANSMPDLLRVSRFRRGRTELGYLRVFSFNTTNPQAFVEAVAQSLQELPGTGVVIDIRGNPGGHILAAETMLQLLTGAPVEPARFSLSTTPLALALCGTHPDFAQWLPSVEQAVVTGETYSQSLPLTAPAELAADLPRYRGPVVLVTDALCYSAADIFAAGFQDNRLGQILGVAGRTGAGGANVWTHDLLRLWLPDQLDQLPAGTGFRIALRRVTRVRANEGVPLEDLGVQPDALHRLTRRDLTDGNHDLLSAAARLVRG